MSDIYDGSPTTALTNALGQGLGSGELGVITARSGVGKSALLAHLSLHYLLQQRNVLHVAIHDTVEHTRAFYDAVIRALGRTPTVNDWASAMVASERHRMIHSFLDRSFKIEALEQSIQMLVGVMSFKPDLLVIDGLDPDLLPELKALASRLSVPAWVAFRTEAAGRSAPIDEMADVRIFLQPVGGDVCMQVSRGRGAVATAEIALDPGTMLARNHDYHGATTKVAPPVSQDCTIYSGGAKGAETAFGEMASRFGLSEVNFTFDGHRQERTVGSYKLSPRELAAGDVSLVYVSKRLSRSYNAEGGLIRRVLQTLWHMVSRSQQVFVVGVIQADGTVVGGTGWSVELARMWNKDLWVFDQDQDRWFRWNGEAWAPGEPQIRSIHFCGTGTRYLKENGRAAIRQLFEDSFKPVA